jgi:hypothetical protein
MRKARTEMNRHGLRINGQWKNGLFFVALAFLAFALFAFAGLALATFAFFALTLGALAGVIGDGGGHRGEDTGKSTEQERKKDRFHGNWSIGWIKRFSRSKLQADMNADHSFRRWRWWRLAMIPGGSIIAHRLRA